LKKAQDKPHLTNISSKSKQLEQNVSESTVKGVNKTVNERLQTKWLKGQIQVRMC
jgi:hypothetical protein